MVTGLSWPASIGGRAGCGAQRCGSVAAVLTFSTGIVHVIVRSGKTRGKGRTFMRRLTFALALIASLCGGAGAQAQTYPSRPITMLVGFPPGGPTDALARLLADAMGRTLGQAIAVETVSGASGTIASGRVVHAAADGYTIGIATGPSHIGSPVIYALDYDVQKDLQPISLLAFSPLWILGKEALPPKSAVELIAWLKAQKSPVTFGTVGTGSAAPLGAVSFANAIGSGNWTSHIGSPAIYALDYDVQKDLQPISLLAFSPPWLLAKGGLLPKRG